MQQAQRSGPDSRSGTSSEGSPAHPDGGERPWHAPVITRLSLDRTLLFIGTVTDGESGSQFPT